MKEPYEKGVAHHLDPESWVTTREGGGQALTGARAGRAIEPRKREVRDADTVGGGGRQHRGRREAQGGLGSRAVLAPEHARKRLTGTWEISRFTTAEGAVVRVEKFKDGSPR
jgi:hypothetical protein